MTGPPIVLVVGQPKSVPIECYVQGSGTVPAIYNSDDILTGAVFPPRSTSAIFTPTVAWYTAGNTQDGYTQGQIQVNLTSSQMAMLQPTIWYTLVAWRALSSDPTNPEMICRRPLLVESISYP